MRPMTPLRLQRLRPRHLARLSPRPQEASVAAVAGLARFSWCSPDQLRPEQSRTSLHHLLVERPLAWSAWNQVACGLQFFSTQTLGWEPLSLHRPPRPRRTQLPHGLRAEELQRLFRSAKNPPHRALLMPTSAAGLRGSAVVHLQVTDMAGERGLLRVTQGTGRKDRSTRLSARLLADLRAAWTLERGQPGRFPGQDGTQPRPLLSAQRMYSRATHAANLQHGTGSHRLRHACATPLLAAGVAPRTLQLLLGHRSLETTPRYLRVARPHLATIQSPLALLRGDPLPPLGEA
jgi:integrase/recombinase XerD